MSTQFTNRQWRLPNNENKDKQSNYSMDFDGGSSTIIETGSILPTSNNFSISFWVNMDNVATSGETLVDNRDSGSTGWGIYVLSNTLYFKLKSNATTTYDITGESGNWLHIVGTYDGSTAKLYVNNATPSSQSITETFNITSNFSIGRRSWSTGATLNGKIDAVAIYNYALSPSQVTTLYGSSSTGIGNPMSLSPKPVAYYPLGDQDAFNGADYLVPNASLQDFVFSFNASNDYINLGNNSVLQPASNYTFSIWFNANSYSYKTLFGSNTSISSGVLALPISNNSMTYYHSTSTTTKQFNISLTDAPINNWHNFTVTWSATTGIIRAFINGKFKVELTGVSDINWGNELLIGRYYATYPFLFDGKLSNFSMWNTTLTDGFSGTPTTGDVAGGQVAEVYNNGSPQTTITGTPVGWWKLDASETYDSSTGNWTIEDHAGSNDGTSSGMTQANLVQSDLSFKTSYSPFALNFDSASSDYIEVPNSTDFDFGTGDFTISAWVNTTGTTTQHRTVVSKQNPSTSGQWSFQVLTDGRVNFYGNNGGIDVLSTTTINDGNWHNIVIQRTGNIFNLYIDKVLADQLTASGQNITNTQVLRIGRRLTGYNAYFDGSISNISIWNAALTSSQVSELYSEGIPQNLNNHSAVSSLVSWWQLGSNSSFNTNWTVLDEKGSNDGTSVNMTEADIVDGVGSYANGVSSGMSDNIVGDAFGSSANSLSYNMDVLDRVEDTPA